MNARALPALVAHALAAALSLVPASARAQDKALTDITLTNGEWPPYLSEHAPYYGVVSRIVTEAFALEGVKVHYLFRPWKRAYTEAEQGDVNGSLVWGPSPGREQAFYFSDTVIEGQSVFFHLRSFAFDWHDDADLVKLKIGGTAGYSYRFLHLQPLAIDRAASDEMSFRKLLAGRFQIFPSDLYGGRATLKAFFTPEEIARITYHRRAYSTTGYHLILVRKRADNARFLALFNHGLARLRASGKYAQYVEALDKGDW